MDSNQPLLSIVIPTRNRVPYAISAIHTILSMPSDRLELVIQDNSDSEKLKDYVKNNFSDNRLIYNHVPNQLSFVENFNQAIMRTSGEYLCLIGDDDGVNPEILEAVEWAKSNNISAIKPGLQVQYLWPGANISSITTKTNGATLTFGHFTCQVQKFDVQIELMKLMKNGGQSYYKRNLPKLYHGIVKKDCVEKVREVTGNYFGGLTPDIYIVVALANVVDKVVTIDYPLTIPGACVGSGSIDSVTGKHTGKLEDAPHFRGHTNYQWADEVPRFYSVETIWADSVIAALRDSKRLDMLQLFNAERLAAYCIMKYPSYSSVIFKGMYHSLRNKGKNRMAGTLKFLLAILSGPVSELFSRVMRRVKLKVRRNTSTSFTEVISIKEATETLTEHLESKGLSFKEIIRNQSYHTK